MIFIQKIIDIFGNYDMTGFNSLILEILMSDVEKRIKELNAAMKQASTLMKGLDAQMAPLKAEWLRLSTLKDDLKKEIDELKKDDFQYVLTNVSAYEQWQAFLPRQAYSDGYWDNAVKEQAWKVMLNYRAEPEPDLIAFINKWVAVAKHKMFNIFRYDLRGDGFWCVEFKNDIWYVFNRRWNDDCEYRPDGKFTDVVEMLKYIAEHHWYEGGPRPNDDDDY